MLDKTDKPAGRFLNCLLIVTEHNKIRRHRTLDLLVDSDFFIPNEMISTEHIFLIGSRLQKMNRTLMGPTHQESVRQDCLLDLQGNSKNIQQYEDAHTR
jgi:hypothetical protein